MTQGNTLSRLATMSSDDAQVVHAPLVYEIVQRPDIQAALASDPALSGPQLIAIALAFSGILLLVRALPIRRHSIIVRLSMLVLLIASAVGMLATRPSVDRITITLNAGDGTRDRIILYHARRSTHIDMDIDLRGPGTRIALPGTGRTRALSIDREASVDVDASSQTRRFELARGASLIVYQPQVTGPPGATHQRGRVGVRSIELSESTLIRLRQRIDQSNLRASMRAIPGP